MRFRVERVVGGTDEQKRDTLDILKEIFETQEHEGLDEIEVEKSAEMLGNIDIANASVKETLAQYGVDFDGVPEDKVHFIKHSDWPERFEGSAAFFAFQHQCIIAPTEVPRLKQVYYLAHEVIHMCSYQAAQVLADSSIDNYRVGLEVTTRNGEFEQNKYLNEAVAEMLAKEAFFSKSFQNGLTKELQEMDALKREYADAVNDDNGEALIHEETFFVDAGSEDSEGNVSLNTSEFTYQKAREGLKLLFGELYNRNPDTFSDIHDTKKLFVQSVFNGNLLTVGKLIDKTFGKGVFRKIAEQDTEEDFLKYIRSLVG